MEYEINLLREWLIKEPYLPKDFDDSALYIFLRSCDGSLERTKNCIEKFCTYRSNMPEAYTDRDPCAQKMRRAFSYLSFTQYLAGENTLYIFEVKDPALENIDFNTAVKAASILLDSYIHAAHNFPENTICIWDLKCVQLKESIPIKIRQVHAINCPSYFDKIYAFVKPLLPQYIIEMIRLHPNDKGLSDYFDKKYLPIEYGGLASSNEEKYNQLIKQVMSNRHQFLDDNKWKADLSKKSKNKTDEAMNGSFRTLSID